MHESFPRKAKPRSKSDCPSFKEPEGLYPCAARGLCSGPDESLFLIFFCYQELTGVTAVNGEINRNLAQGCCTKKRTGIMNLNFFVKSCNLIGTFECHIN